VLSALLPGVRELRTPLAIGVMYFICAWMVFGGQLVLIATQNPTGARLLELASLVGRPTALAVMAVALYILGSLLQLARLPLRRIERVGPSARLRAIQIDKYRETGMAGPLPTIRQLILEFVTWVAPNTSTATVERLVLSRLNVSRLPSVWNEIVKNELMSDDFRKQMSENFENSRGAPDYYLWTSDEQIDAARAAARQAMRQGAQEFDAVY
jgi:hypothetical protein